MGKHDGSDFDRNALLNDLSANGVRIGTTGRIDGDLINGNKVVINRGDRRDDDRTDRKR